MTGKPQLRGTDTPHRGVGSFLRSISRWLRRMDPGSLPIMIAVAFVAVIFGVLEPLFFNERNFVNLILQMAGIFAISIGVVFVLLIAEIDLSVAYVSAIGGVTMTLLLREGESNWPWWLAILTALAITTLIGYFHGIVITKGKVPSFVVTLAGLMAWSGVVQILTTEFSTAGTIVIQDPIVLGIANSYLNASLGWLLYAAAVIGYVFTLLLMRRSRTAQGLAAEPLKWLFFRIALMMAFTGVAVDYANRDRGVPVVAVLMLGLMVFWSFIANWTRFGRYVYAVGGNAEAARRAGIDVDRVRTAVFMISGFMAGVGGIILASRLRSVDTNTGGGNLMLNAIAAAVIGGTSLFGGRGRVTNALLGALIITSVENGMGLVGLPSGVKFVINGLVLLAAVLLDAFSRQSRESKA